MAKGNGWRPWWWWAGSGSNHRCRWDNTRHILSLPIGNFTEITVSNSDNALSLVRAMSARFSGGMPEIPEVEIWWTVLLWMVLLSVFYSSLYFITSLDLSPVQMASAWVFTTSANGWSGGGVSRCAGSAKWPPYGAHLLWALWVRTFAYVEWLFDCCHSFLLSYRIM